MEIHLNHDDRRRNFAAGVEVEGYLVVRGDPLGEATGHHLGQGLLLGLGLPGQLGATVAKSSNVVLK